MPDTWRRFRLLFLGILSRRQSSLWSMSYHLRIGGSSSLLSVWYKQRRRPLSSAASNPHAVRLIREQPLHAQGPYSQGHCVLSLKPTTSPKSEGMAWKGSCSIITFSSRGSESWNDLWKEVKSKPEKSTILSTQVGLVYPGRRQTWFFLRGFMWQEPEPTDSTPK